MQDTLFSSLVADYSSLRYSAVTGRDFYTALTDSASHFALLNLPVPNKNCSLITNLESLWQQVEYPNKDRDKIRYGDVELMALINEKGELKSLEYRHSFNDKDYDKRAKKVIENNTVFSTAEYLGNPVPYWCYVPIRFEKPIFPEDTIPWWNIPKPKKEIPDTLTPMDSLNILAEINDSTVVSNSPHQKVESAYENADSVSLSDNKIERNPIIVTDSTSKTEIVLRDSTKSVLNDSSTINFKSTTDISTTQKDGFTSEFSQTDSSFVQNSPDNTLIPKKANTKDTVLTANDSVLIKQTLSTTSIDTTTR